jgi:5-(carboxyamino)imidazole ribonucleotide synthase
MYNKNLLHQPIGILGGGQLGKMLAIEAAHWHLPLHILDKRNDFPAAPYAPYFKAGDFRNYDDVYHFGKNLAILTIEIEQVNVDALIDLEIEGVKIFPKPATIKIIQDKGLQKQFYADNNIPTAAFQFFQNAEEVRKALQKHQLKFPFVQKSREDGYDGKGVVIISEEKALFSLLDCPNIVEEKIRVKKEISVIVARSVSGEIKHFEPVEQHFNQDANLVSYLICPADIPDKQKDSLTALAYQIAREMDLVGLLAIEFFISENDMIYVNEVAPRPHNSGHHTQNSCETSQFEQHLRAILDLPLGSTRQHSIGAMVNMIGEPGYTGAAKYTGIKDCMKMEGVHMHLYGKGETKPYRKMGHVNITGNDREKVLEKIHRIKGILKVMA